MVTARCANPRHAGNIKSKVDSVVGRSVGRIVGRIGEARADNLTPGV